jgi:hypothetical protein
VAGQKPDQLIAYLQVTLLATRLQLPVVLRNHEASSASCEAAQDCGKKALVRASHGVAQDCDRTAQVMASLIHCGTQLDVQDTVLESRGYTPLVLVGVVSVVPVDMVDVVAATPALGDTAAQRRISVELDSLVE